MYYTRLASNYATSDLLTCSAFLRGTLDRRRTTTKSTSRVAAGSTMCSSAYCYQYELLRWPVLPSTTPGLAFLIDSLRYFPVQFSRTPVPPYLPHVSPCFTSVVRIASALNTYTINHSFTLIRHGAPPRSFLFECIHFIISKGTETTLPQKCAVLFALSHRGPPLMQSPSILAYLSARADSAAASSA